MKISLTDTDTFIGMLKLIRKIYQHDHCPKMLKSYIRFECGKFFNPEWDIKKFLEGKDE